MIITCNNCNKKFDLDSNLIPDKGRLLQCASCNHKWFFKKEILENTVSPIVEDIDNDNVNVFDQNNPTNDDEINPSDLSREQVEIDTVEELDEKIEIYNKEKTEKNIEVNINEDIPVISKPKKPKKFKILNSFIVAIISSVAFIIIVDTFKYPIGKIVPNIEFILYNLYESIKDISLFIRDLT
ncbi:zinc-ribbon domain-containing protein [Candidatus Pelagibacter sp.]|nr:zinc-ribbon domain-containing protein [Candidatus Pelagibacter sp.]